MNSKYIRVLPRDLFNEAKLLKCIGRLCLLIHDNTTPIRMSFIDDGKPFEIALMDEGALTVVNVRVLIHLNDDPMEFVFKTIYNRQSNFPLYVEHDGCDYLVFNEAGNFSEEFNEFIKIIEIDAND